MKEQIIDIIRDGEYRIPSMLLKNYKNLKINELDLIILIYLINQKEREFNPNKICSDLNMQLLDVMNSIDNLTKTNFVKIEPVKENKVTKDVINLDNLYDKLVYLIMNEKEEKSETDIYSIFEKEFGRTLAPMEYEIINSWLDSGYEKELVIQALKEAVFNGVFKLNYIDKILYEWSKKGIKTPKDITVSKQNHKEQKKELYDYNWLED